MAPTTRPAPPPLPTPGSNTSGGGPAPTATTPTTTFIGVANLPNQRHRIVSRTGTPLNILLVGESGLGKTTFINTLFTTELRERKQYEARFNPGPGATASQTTLSTKTVRIHPVKVELQEKGFNLKLAVYDTPGFGEYIDNTDAWKPVVAFINEQHAVYQAHEEHHTRNPLTFTDPRIHVCLYFISPKGHNLSPLDICTMKELCNRVNLVPVIAKADTMTLSEMAEFKRRVRETMAVHGITIYSPELESEDEDTTTRNKSIMAACPFAVIASDTDVMVDGKKVRGRAYTWGTSLVESDEHCDFKKLRNLLIRTHMSDLIETTHSMHYEELRAERLLAAGRSDEDPSAFAKKTLEMKLKEEEDALRKRFTEQVKLEEARFRKWEQKLISERDRLNKDLEDHHRVVKLLEEGVDELASKMVKK